MLISPFSPYLYLFFAVIEATIGRSFNQAFSHFDIRKLAFYERYYGALLFIFARRTCYSDIIQAQYYTTYIKIAPK